MTDQTFAAIEAPAVFAEVESTGRHSAITSMPLHEAVVARLNLEATGESLIIHDKWPDWASDRQVATRSLRDEYARLQRNYGKELLVSVYGQPHEGRLRKVMLRIHEAFVKGIKRSKIIQLGSPEGDFIELPPGQSIDAAQEPALADRLLGKDTDAAAKVDSTELSKINAAATTPEGVKELGGDDTVEEKPLDGSLIEFLTENGWNEPQANAIARVARDKGIQSIHDADLSTIQGLRNADARKSLRQHLLEYRSKAKVSA